MQKAQPPAVHRLRFASPCDVRHPSQQVVCRHQGYVGAGVAIAVRDQPAGRGGHYPVHKLFRVSLVIRPEIDHDVARADVGQGHRFHSQAIARAKGAPHAAAVVEADAILNRHLSHHNSVNGIPVHVILREKHPICGGLVAGIVEDLKGPYLEALREEIPTVQVLVPKELQDIP